MTRGLRANAMGNRAMGRLVSARRSAYRYGYFLAMYSGLRALVQRARSRGLPLHSSLRRLDGVRPSATSLGDVVVRVHARRSGDHRSGDHGMLSIRSVAPNAGGLVERYFRATSHFGCAQLEVAFYERRGHVTAYAVRNTARANAARLGLAGVALRLSLSVAREDLHGLRLAAALAGEAGHTFALAAPADCVRLGIDPQLLAPERLARASAALLVKYERLQRALAGSPGSRVAAHPERPAPSAREQPPGAAPHRALQL